MKGSDYVEQQRREYSLYTLQSRAVPHAADGLKSAARRVLWVASDGKKYKSSNLAGATMPIHPHDAPTDAINTIAGFYKNNIPLLKGEGAFGTLLVPTAFAASRYTSVSASTFTKDVMYRDIEIIPMIENYDQTLMEPKHFLPLIPMAFINPQEGVAVGFACEILPRNPATVIKDQIKYLEEGKVPKEPKPTFLPINQVSIGKQRDKFNNEKWMFTGSFERKGASSVVVTSLPYGLLHEKFIDRLVKMEDEEKINGYEDNSRDKYNIEITFKRGAVSDMTDEQILSMLGLVIGASENFNLIDFDGEQVWATSYTDYLTKFTDWRLKWYYTRYERLAKLLADEIQRYKDVIRAIEKNVGGVAKKVKSRSELCEFCKEIGIVHLEYIADLPVYRFTEQEKEKTEAKLKEKEKLMKEYQALLKSEQKRKDVYVDELVEVLSKFQKGLYAGHY